MKTLPIVPAVALAALILTMAAGGWQSIRLVREHTALAAELKALGEPGGSATAPDRAKSDPLIERAQAELERESAQLTAALVKVAEAEKGLPQLKGEELRSLGRIDELGRKAGQFLDQFIESAKRMHSSENKMSEEESNKFIEQMMPWMERVEVIGTMEDNPQEIADLHAATIAERLKLDASTVARLKIEIAREFSELAAAGLIRSQRPEGDGIEDWQKRRSEALKGAVARVEAVIPESQRRPWVVEQSMQLGNSLRNSAQIGPDGHGSMNLSIALPGT